MCDVQKLKLHLRACDSQEQTVAIIRNKKDPTIWLCAKCWKKVSATDFECGDSKPMSLRRILNRRKRELKEGKLTVYVSKKKAMSPKRKK